MTVASPLNGSLASPPFPPPTPMRLCQVGGDDEDEGGGDDDGRGMMQDGMEYPDDEVEVCGMAGEWGGEGETRKCESSDGEGRAGEDGGQEEGRGEVEVGEEEEQEEEGVGLKLRAKYGRWVSGDCISCSTRPPSALALIWLPRCLRKDYRVYLNVTHAAARGDTEAQRRLVDESGTIAVCCSIV